MVGRSVGWSGGPAGLWAGGRADAPRPISGSQPPFLTDRVLRPSSSLNNRWPSGRPGCPAAWLPGVSGGPVAAALLDGLLGLLALADGGRSDGGGTRGCDGGPLSNVLTELCLTVPARLSAVLPHMPRLTRPVLLALRSGDGA